PSAVEDAQIVIIATPVQAIENVMEIIGPRLTEGVLVTDTGSCKSVVMEWADQYLPRHASFVGGNPMVGKDVDGPSAADGNLFRDRPYCIVPAQRANRDAVRQMSDMVNAIGAKPYFIDIAEHDSFACAVTQLPLLISIALVGCTSKSPSWGDIAQMASTQYKDLTSQASGDPDTHKGIFVNDTGNTVHWIDAFIRELYDIRQILTSDSEEKNKLQDLEKVFSQAVEARNRWLAGALTPGYRDAANRPAIPSASENISDLFLGSHQTRRRIFGMLGGNRHQDSIAKK
ncbi:MAG: prephenate dehydrogenase, partial [Dehalococcoidia bacterium]|nr:prephenate dehydrogenase [Dehalococcoidia bacterium]